MKSHVLLAAAVALLLAVVHAKQLDASQTVMFLPLDERFTTRDGAGSIYFCLVVIWIAVLVVSPAYAARLCGALIAAA